MITGTPWWFTTLYVGFCSVMGLGFAVASFRSGELLWMPLLTISAMILGFFLMSALIPTVRMDEGFLYVSRLGRSAVIPLAEVASVSQTHFLWQPAATIHFRSDNAFGRSLLLGSQLVPGMTFPGALDALRSRIAAGGHNNT